MKREELLEHTDRLLGKFRAQMGKRDREGDVLSPGTGERAEVEEFLRRYAGDDSAFYRRLQELSLAWFSYGNLVSALDGYRSFVEAGLSEGVSPEREAQFDVVTDLLDLSESLLKDTDVHPGAAAMLIGATLEEYLRVWVERLGLDLGTQKPGIDTYARLLRAEDAIGKQDVKLITTWAGYRNDAAHGDWDKVSNREEIRMMLAGVQLFMQTHGA